MVLENSAGGLMLKKKIVLCCNKMECRMKCPSHAFEKIKGVIGILSLNVVLAKVLKKCVLP